MDRVACNFRLEMGARDAAELRGDSDPSVSGRIGDFHA